MFKLMKFVWTLILLLVGVVVLGGIAILVLGIIAEGA